MLHYGGLLEIFFETKVRRCLYEQNISMSEILTSTVPYSSCVFLQILETNYFINNLKITYLSLIKILHIFLLLSIVRNLTKTRCAVRKESVVMTTKRRDSPTRSRKKRLCKSDRTYGDD